MHVDLLRWSFCDRVNAVIGAVYQMANNEQSERRSTPRRAENWRVLFGQSGQLVTGYLADMSPIGVSILTESGLPMGTEIDVHFGIEEGKSSGRLQMRGVVRHYTRGKMGVQFLNVDAAQREHWWKILRGAR